MSVAEAQVEPQIFKDETLARAAAQVMVLAGESLQSGKYDYFVQLEIASAPNGLSYLRPHNQRQTLTALSVEQMSVFQLSLPPGRHQGLTCSAVYWPNPRSYELERRERLAVDEAGRPVRIEEVATDKRANDYEPTATHRAAASTIISMAKRSAKRANPKTEGQPGQPEISPILYSRKDILAYQEALVPVIGQLAVVAGEALLEPRVDSTLVVGIELDLNTYRLYNLLHDWDGKSSNRIFVNGRNLKTHRLAEFNLETKPLLGGRDVAPVEASLEVIDFAARPRTRTRQWLAQGAEQLFRQKQREPKGRLYEEKVDSLQAIVEMAKLAVAIANGEEAAV